MSEAHMDETTVRTALNLLSQYRTASDFNELRTITNRLLDLVDCLEMIEIGTWYEDGSFERMVNSYGGSDGIAPMPFQKKGTQRIVDEPCVPKDYAVMKIEGEQAFSCQKGSRQVSAVCMRADLRDQATDPTGMQLLRTILPFLHDAVTRIAELRDTHDAGLDITEREHEVLHWIRKGKTNWEIGAILGLSERTVKFHVSNLFKKLGVTRRAQAAAHRQVRNKPDSRTHFIAACTV